MRQHASARAYGAVVNAGNWFTVAACASKNAAIVTALPEPTVTAQRHRAMQTEEVVGVRGHNEKAVVG